MADPASVPAGKYGKAALTALGVWDKVAAKVVQAENVRVALEYVARGEAPFGIVYATDAKIAPVKVVGTFPENTHPPIIYPVALTKSASPAARAISDLSGRAGSARDFREGGLHAALALVFARSAAALFQQGDAFDHHAAIRRLQHVVDGQAGDRHRRQRLHLHAGLALVLARAVTTSALWVSSAAISTLMLDSGT